MILYNETTGAMYFGGIIVQAACMSRIHKLDYRKLASENLIISLFCGAKHNFNSIKLQKNGNKTMT